MTRRPGERGDEVKPSIIVHGGAGGGRYGEGDPRFTELEGAVSAGRAAMKKGSSLDGVEAAVRFMESSGHFNAGRGACLTSSGTVELDAAIMSGVGLIGAGVGLVTCTYNPISLARWVMQRTPHVLIVGDGCRAQALEAEMVLEDLRPSPESLRRFKQLTHSVESVVGRPSRRIGSERGNTVGAVAVDSSGVPAAAVSTGGTWLKFPGRIGDSAIIGAGVYADARAGAACATGTGEEIIRNALSLRACDFLRRYPAQDSASRAIRLMTRASGEGSGGIITVDLKGRLGASFNTEAMGRAWWDRDRDKVVVRAAKPGHR
ncbi:MAG: isoaspartyl peptidase/L-asparaginase [Thaumarchaeota archaeon]|nr:isoaspartyl peptidase/L-asparaginase [Nitrososphaerota archaeon]